MTTPYRISSESEGLGYLFSFSSIFYSTQMVYDVRVE